MRLISLRLLALVSLGLPTAASAHAATNPRYGGTLHVELSAASMELDPRGWEMGEPEFATNEKLAALMLERLVALDNYGRMQPVLATEWSHDAASKRWQFAIREGVKFSGGSVLRAEDVVVALQTVAPDSWKIYVAGNAVVIESAAPMPDLLERLASGQYFIFARTSDKALLGTGPFVLGAPPGETDPTAAEAAAHGVGSHLFFRANDEAWSGRPFLDAIDVTLGVSPLRALFDLQLGKADLIELSPELVPRAKQANVRVWLSEPLTLYGLRFDPSQSSVSDPRLRQALSLALDRDTMANVLLQKQATPATALLPQWLSGYAFLFNVESNSERAKELRRSLGAGLEPLRLRVEAAGDLPKLLGERVAVNARQAGIAVQVVAKPATRSVGGAPAPAQAPAGLHLFSWHYSSLSARAELDSMFAAYNLSEPAEMNGASTEREQLYARERSVLEDWRMLPLVEQVEPVGLGANVRDWMPSRWGEWHLADVWLDSSQPATPAPSAFRFGVAEPAGLSAQSFPTARDGARGVRP